jgi:hypothetical protein
LVAHIGVDVNLAHKPIESLESLQKLLPQLGAVGVPIIWLNWGNPPD